MRVIVRLVSTAIGLVIIACLALLFLMAAALDKWDESCYNRRKVDCENERDCGDTDFEDF